MFLSACYLLDSLCSSPGLVKFLGPPLSFAHYIFHPNSDREVLEWPAAKQALIFLIRLLTSHNLYTDTLALVVLGCFWMACIDQLKSQADRESWTADN